MSTLSLVNTFEGHDARLWHASWSHSGKYIASCGEDKVIRIWGDNSNSSKGTNEEAFSSATCLATLEEGQSRTIRCCEWSPCGTMIASASFDGTVVVWETQDNSLRRWVQIATLEGHENEVKSVGWSCDGSWLATCGRDKKVWVWEKIVGGDFECSGMLDGHTQDVKFVKWHPNLNVLFSASYDDTVKIWHCDNDDDWYCTKTLEGHTSTVWNVSLNSVGDKLVTCSDDKSIHLWECDKANAEGEWRVSSKLSDVHKHPIYSIDWSHTHGYIVSGGGDNALVLSSYSKADGIGMLQYESHIPESHNGDVNCVRWNPRGDIDTLSCLLLSAGDDGTVKIWKLAIP